MDISTKFGKRVKQVRTTKKLSQGDLAKKLRVDPSYVSKIERGIQNPSLKGIAKIATALGVPIKKLIF